MKYIIQIKPKYGDKVKVYPVIYDTYEQAQGNISKTGLSHRFNYFNIVELDVDEDKTFEILRNQIVILKITLSNALTQIEFMNDINPSESATEAIKSIKEILYPRMKI